jgi:hypothetical protein
MRQYQFDQVIYERSLILADNRELHVAVTGPGNAGR